MLTVRIVLIIYCGRVEYRLLLICILSACLRLTFIKGVVILSGNGVQIFTLVNKILKFGDYGVNLNLMILLTSCLLLVFLVTIGMII